MQSDFGDIRFGTTEGGEFLSYHLKEYTPEDSATFIVKIPLIPISPETITVYVYADNPSATSISDPDSTYLFFDDATGTYEDKWVNIQGSGSYGTVGGRAAINLASATTNILNNVEVEAPFKIEADLYATELITAIQYCQDSTPTTNEKYHARLDVRSPWGDHGWESILNDNVRISNMTDQYGTASTWVSCVLTLDSDGHHTWTVNNSLTPATVTDITHTSGYLVLNHHNSGTGAVSNLVVSRYTPHPPVVGEIDWGWDQNITLTGGVVYVVPDLPELELSNHYYVNVGGTDYE